MLALFLQAEAAAAETVDLTQALADAQEELKVQRRAHDEETETLVRTHARTHARTHLLISSILD